MNFDPKRHDQLQEAMEFDHVVRVLPDGKVADAPDVVFVPDVTVNGDGDMTPHVSPEGSWQLLDGYSAQWQYSGPIMHRSEFIGGRMADDILSEPGVYVCVVVTDLSAGDDEDSDADAGWAVARMNDGD